MTLETENSTEQHDAEVLTVAIQLDDVTSRTALQTFQLCNESAKKRSISEMMPDPLFTEEKTTGIPSSIPVKKKVKLAEEVREQKRREKEVKDMEREKKEEEKRREKEMRDKEKEIKKAEKEEKRRLKEKDKRKKDEEKAKRDTEKLKKDEEKAKKNRAQRRLNDFFTKQANSPEIISSTPTLLVGNVDPAREASSSDQNSSIDYVETFLPFFVKQHVTVAGIAFQRDNSYKKTVTESLDAVLWAHDEILTDSDTGVPKASGLTREDIATLLHIPPNKMNKKIRRPTTATKDILARINASHNPHLLHISSTQPPSITSYNSAHYIRLLNSLPNKFLKFSEDVRPPYCGTYTRNPTTTGLRDGRNPFQRSMPGVLYDYDSEAEWVADEDGEDLMSEDEEDKDSVGESDLDGFLDDDDDSGIKMGRTGVLIASNSGLCWEGSEGFNQRRDLQDMRMCVLIEGFKGPIDPFSQRYWFPDPLPQVSVRSAAMEPPQCIPANPNRNLIITSHISDLHRNLKDSQKKLVPTQDMDAFKKAIEGSDMTKTGLIEVLKKAFPKTGKDAIRNTIDLVAERVGERRDDKRWVLK